MWRAGACPLGASCLRRGRAHTASREEAEGSTGPASGLWCPCQGAAAMGSARQRLRGNWAAVTKDKRSFSGGGAWGRGEPLQGVPKSKGHTMSSVVTVIALPLPPTPVKTTASHPKSHSTFSRAQRWLGA